MIMPFLFNFIFILAFTLFTLGKVRKDNPKGLQSFFVFTFYYHLLFTLLIYFFQFVGDAEAFYRWSFTQENWPDSFGLGSKFLIFIIHPFIYYFKLTPLTLSILFSIISFWGIYLSSISLFRNKGIKPGLILLVLLPGLSFWTSRIGKDAITLFTIGIVIYELSKRQPRFMILTAAITLALLIRPYFVTLISSSMAIAFFLDAKISIKQRIYYTGASVLYTLASLATFLSHRKVTSKENLSQKIELRQTSWTEGGSTLNLSELNFIERVITFLYKPFFYDASSIKMYLASFENFILLGFSILFIYFSIKSFSYSLPKRTSTFCGAMIILGVILFSTVTANLGTAVRKKILLIPPFIVLYGNVRYREKHAIKSNN